MKTSALYLMVVLGASALPLHADGLPVSCGNALLEVNIARDLDLLRQRIGSKAAEIDHAETKLAMQRADLQALRNQEAELLDRLGG